MAEERSGFDFFGKLMETTKIYAGSDTVKKFNAVVQPDSLEMLGSYAREHGIISKGTDMDSKADDRLQKYSIIKITPTRHLDELDNPMEMYLIVDEFGHDIGTYEITENGPVFKLSPKIQEYNKKVIQKSPENEKKFLEDKYSIDTLQKLVEKISKGEEIALSSKEQAIDDISEGYEKKGLKFEEDKKQDEEEKEALEKIPADMRGEAIKFARQNKLKVKEILVVDSPKELSKQIDNRENQISPNGGSVILIRASHGGADSLGDDVYAFQDGKAIQSEKNDNTLEDLMEQHRDEGQVQTVTDDEGIRLKEEVEEIIEEANAKIIEYEKMKRYDIESEDKDEVMNYYDKEIAYVVAERDSKLQALARERYPLPPFDEKGIDEIEIKVEETQEEPADDRGENEEGQDDNGEHSERTIYEGHEKGQSPYGF